MYFFSVLLSLNFSDGKAMVKVIAGESMGTKAVIETRSPIMYLDVRVSPRGSFTQKIPTDYNCFVYTWRGSGFVGDSAVKMGQVGNGLIGIDGCVLFLYKNAKTQLLLRNLILLDLIIV